MEDLYLTIDNILEWATQYWYIVAPMLSSPFVVVYLLKLAVLYIGNKKGKNVLDQMIDSFWGRFQTFMFGELNTLKNEVLQNEDKLGSEIKTLKNQIESFNKVILDQKENVEIKAEYEKILLQNQVFKSQLEEKKKEVEDIKEKTTEKVEDKKEELKGVAKKIVDSNTKNINKKIDKISKKVKKEVEQNEIYLD